VQAVLLDEEERRRRAKAERFAAMDKRAGIDRRLVEMSAAEKRKLERIEREKKEAEKRRWAWVPGGAFFKRVELLKLTGQWQCVSGAMERSVSCTPLL
jgi:hypothetical protein